MKGTRKTAALAVMLLMAMAVAGCDVLQDHFLYFPDHVRPSAGSLTQRGLAFWMVSENDYRGLVSAPETDTPAGTVIVFHGNAGKAADRGFYAKTLVPLNYRVILAEYPGYGGRPGSRGEDQFVKDARRTVEAAFAEYGAPIYLLGESLGCGVVAAVAGRSPVPVEGIVLFTPWDSLLSVAASHAPAFIARLVLKDRYDSVANLATFGGKTAIIGAERDDIIPVGHAEALYASIPGRKRMWTIKGAGHNDWPMFASDAMLREIMDFVVK
ncbi:MAG: alpha/beta hydrolase [Syntrophorhabdus sp.]|jgi:pimeloyl-ACP methyl ester carboxylesterase|nr:alpha/beta hydrolase [Syntrophorhabdus sp.]